MTNRRLARAKPAQKAVDAAGIAAFLDAVEREGVELHSFMLYRAGAVVAEGFWHPYAPERVHMQHSATKSWASTAMGLAIGEGRLSIDDKVISFFPDQLPAIVSGNLAAMTVRDLLTMRTGHSAGISGGEWRGLRTSWVEAFLREPVEHPPGKDFIYSSATSYMISAIVTKVTGQRLRDYLERRLFEPLGMGHILWDVSPEGINTGGNGLTCTTEDALKFGILHLQDGMWEGRRILPEGWVAEATRKQVENVWVGALNSKRFLPRGEGAVERREGYGYQWWMAKNGGYLASGNFGQQSLVLPQKDAVVAFTGGLRLRERRHLDAFWTHLYPALDVAAPDGSADEAVAGRLADLALPRPAGAAHGPQVLAISGQRYLFEENEDKVREASLAFSGDTCLFTLQDHRGEHRIEAGLGRLVEQDTTMTGYYLHHEYQPDSMRVAAQGSWLDQNRFQMIWRFVETAFSDTVLCTFEGDSLRLERSVNTNAGPLGRPPLHGKA